KLIVTGADRSHALARSRRALAEFEVGGMPTVLPFHRAVLEDRAFTSAPFAVHTRWIETEFAGQLAPYAGEGPGAVSAGSPGVTQTGPAGGRAGERERIGVEVGGKRLEGVLPGGLGGTAGAHGRAARSGGGGGGAPDGGTVGPGGRGGAATGGGQGRRAGRGRGSGGGAGVADGQALVSPMQGTIVKIVAANGQRVVAGDVIVVLEAMKMEQPLTAHKDGTVSDLTVEVGQTGSARPVICRLAE